MRTAARAVCEFKGLSHPALRLVLHEADAVLLGAALETMLGADENAFEWEPVVIDASRIAQAEGLALAALVDRLRAARLHPVALAGANPALREAADRLQLGWTAAPPERRTPAAAATDPAAAAAAADTAAPTPTAAAAASEPTREPGSGPALAEPEPPPRPPVPPGALVIERPVRSGQQVYARERDLVVIGDVSPGAEVIADGHVHVYGTLGGRAIAGARGQRDAGIFTLGLRAELVAVCGIYRTFEDGPPAQHLGKPVRISLEANADTLSLRPL